MAILNGKMAAQVAQTIRNRQQGGAAQPTPQQRPQGGFAGVMNRIGEIRAARQQQGAQPRSPMAGGSFGGQVAGMMQRRQAAAGPAASGGGAPSSGGPVRAYADGGKVCGTGKPKKNGKYR